MKEWQKNLSVIIIIIALGIVYQYKYINDYPSHIHAWAQADRYALSLGFLDNGLNFTKPQTFIYNHQFPNNWEIPSESTITAVDFPIHDYMPALFMKLTGSTSPWVFRGYVLLYSLLGLFFLYKLAYLITSNYFKSLFVILFAATSPVFVYYQGGFLPSVPSLANATIGAYFYYRHIKDNKLKLFTLSILFFTLAALARTTFAIPLIAICCVEFIRLMRKDTRLFPKIIPVVASAILIVFYLYYNGHLREKYGSMFLNHWTPPDNFKQAKEIVQSALGMWKFHYFTRIHYHIYFGITIIAVIFFVIKRILLNKVNAYNGLYALIYLTGSILFTALMLRQLVDHDYYFLDTLYLPAVILLAVFLSRIPNPDSLKLKIGAIAIIVLLAFKLIPAPAKSQESRRLTGPWDKNEVTLNNYYNSATFLDSLGISHEAKMLVIDAVAPNLPFSLMQRKGYAVMYTSNKNIESSLTWDYDYIVLQNRYFVSDIHARYPEILTKLNKVADNGKISVCTLSDTINRQTMLGFLSLNENETVFKSYIDFDSEPDSSWQNINLTNEVAYSGSSSGHLTPDMEYGLTWKTDSIPELLTGSRTLIVKTRLLRNSVIDCDFIVAVNDGGQNVYYSPHNLKYYIKKQGEWEDVCLMYQLPKVQSENYELSIYFWNKWRNELYCDDFSFSVY